MASNGDEALQLWKQNNYDLIFMDIGLPDMDGYQVTRHIRVQEMSENRNTPIIALTAHVGEENKQRCIEAGMNAVLSKPLSQKGCIEILGSFIPKQQEELIQRSWASEIPVTENEFFDLSPFPILDIEEGIKTSGSEEMLCEMLQFMLNQSLPEDITLLKKAHDSLDWEKTQQLAHKIKGGLIYVGAVRMKMACQYLERYWKTGQQELLEQLYQQLLQVKDASIVKISQWIKKDYPPE